MMKRNIDFRKSGGKFAVIFMMTAICLLFVLSPEKIVTAKGAITSMKSSDDTYSGTQWYINNPGYYTNYALGHARKSASTKGIDMNIVEAWDNMNDEGKADREVVVAIIDTGVDYKHKELSEHIWTNEGEIKGDDIDNDNNGYVDDYYGWDFYNKDASVSHYAKGRVTASFTDNDNHGTHIAGTIAATADNNIGIAGIASKIDIKLMILKINGGEKEQGKMSDAVEAIKYATMMGADICNLSWGTEEYSDELYEAMKESDMLFVAAAGSDGTNNDKSPLYPANFKLDNLITVTTVNADGELPSYTNYGVKSVDIAAPGENIFSTIVGGYGIMSGSSMAAPQVTSIAALLYAYQDHTYASNVKDIILTHLKQLPELQGKIRYPGMPDAYQCILAADEIQQDNDAPELLFKTEYNQKVITVPVSVQDIGGSRVRVIKWIFGKKKVTDFKHGTNGTLVEDDKVDLSVAGTYTFYASDYAGNEKTFAYEVTDDKSAPILRISYNVADDYATRTVKIMASDEQSGIKRIKYMSGEKEAKDFLPADAGKKISLKNGKGTFTVKKDGTYTLFAVDYRGNMEVKVITVKTVKSSGIQFEEQEIKLNKGDVYYLRLLNTPDNSTDKISFTSQNEQIAEVSSTGKVTTRSKGTVIITARTSSGIKAICKVTIYSDA